MIIFHAAVDEKFFFLWGETPGEKSRKVIRRRQKNLRRTAIVAESLVYDAGPGNLSAGFKEAGFDFGRNRKSYQPLIAWLPTKDHEPVPSSPLIAQLPEGKRDSALHPFTVTALALSTQEIVELLSSFSPIRILAPGVLPGRDLVFWSQVLRFAGSLVARQRFLPGLANEDGRYRAVWKPVLEGVDLQGLNHLANALPEVSRAGILPEKQKELAGHLPHRPAVHLVSRFLERMVDYLVRSAIDREEDRRWRDPSKPSADLHDRWLNALLSPDGAMQGDSAAWANLEEQVKEWQRPILLTADAPFQLCFRLEEPEDKSEGDGEFQQGPWFVRYLLQSNEDPSLLIPAQKAWKLKEPSSRKPKKSFVLMPKGFNPREYLLLSLGQAAGICPRIESSLAASAPGGYRLDGAGANEFLTQKALALKHAGFGVMLPAWWTGKGTKLRLAVKAHVQTPKMQGAAGLSLDEIVQFNWEAALGTERLSWKELRALARMKMPLIKVRGQWVQVNAEEIEAALAAWKKKAVEPVTARDVLQMALGGGRIRGHLPIEGITATGWIGDLIGDLKGHLPFQELDAPEGFQGVLRPYQIKGYSWLAFLQRWGLGTCLADDMGLGKTVQTLALLQKNWKVNGRRPVFLACPTSVVNNWQKEANRFTPGLPVMVHHGIGRTRGESFRQEAMKQALVISSYSLMHRDFEILKQIPWAGMILDEAQNIKNPETKQARAARMLPADFRIALTGTPVENNVGDIWSIMEFLNPGFLGSQADFKRTFFIPIQAARDPGAMEKLKRLTGPFILRRLKTDKAIIADLPDKMEMKVYCPLTKEQASLYQGVVEEAFRKIDPAEGVQRRGIILATLSKLKQVCNHPAHFLGDLSPLPGRSGKLARLTEMAEEMLSVGDRALIFSQFAEMGSILQRHLQENFGREVLFLHGGVPKGQRDRMVERFQREEDDSPCFFVLSLKAGGTGLNLTRANQVIHFDRWWNPAVENQATDRAFRIGQTKNVQVYKFICSGTLEEKIDALIERKKEITESVVGTGEGWLTELSTHELRELFTLRKEAVEG